MNQKIVEAIETLVDIRDVHVDPNLPKEERIREYVRQIKNLSLIHI